MATRFWQALFVGMVLLWSVARLHADPIAWSFQGTLYDQTQHTGSFTYDPGTNSVGSWDMGLWRGDSGGATFNSTLNNPGDANTYPYSSTADAGPDSFNNGWDINFRYTQYDPIEISPGNYEPGYDFYTLQLVFSNALTAGSGTTPIVGASNYKGSYFYFSNDSGGGSAYPILSGSVTEVADVPEPAFLSWVGAIGLGGVFALRRLGAQRRKLRGLI